MKSSTFYSLNPLKRQLLSSLLLVSAFILPVALQAQSDSAVLWAEQFEGGFGLSYKGSIVSDALGNTYMTGRFSDTVDFGDITLTAVAETDIFVVKTDALGTVLWAKQFGGTNEIYGHLGIAIAADDLGNVYTTGTFYGTITFGSITLTPDNPDVKSIFVVKQDAAGTVLWASEFTGVGGIFNPLNITTDSEGNVYTTGEFNADTATFGTITLERKSVGTSSSDAFVVKQN